MYKFLYCSLLALPLTSHAQSPVTPSIPSKAYVGIGINGGRYYDKRNGDFLSSGLLYTPTLEAGIQLSPSLALQLGINPYEYKFEYTVQSVNYPTMDRNNPVISYRHGQLRRQYYILPLLARYTFTGSEKRLKIDGLLGTSIYHTRSHSTTTISDSQFQVTNQYNYSSNATYANLVLGAGLRYALFPHLEVASELRVNPFYFGYSAGFYPNLDLSVRYCFGTLKAKNASLTPASSLPDK